MSSVQRSDGRRDVVFSSGEGECAAWWFTPSNAGAKNPVVIMAHGLGAVKEMRLDAYAEQFAAAGWCVLVFDYRHLGASSGEPRQLLDIDRQLADWRSALAYVRSLPHVDPDRIALWGTSFGGGHALQTAADDRRVAAVVAQCPFTDGPASLMARLRVNPVSALLLTVAGVIDLIGSKVGAKPLLMPMAGVSWMPAFVAAPSALTSTELLPSGTRLSRRTSNAVRRLPSVRRRLSANLDLTDADGTAETSTHVGRDTIWGVLRGPDGSFDAANALPARLVLRLPLYRPGRSMSRIAAPVLLCVCDGDTAAPANATSKLASGLDHVQVQRYDCDHFDIYVGDQFARAVADQIDFLTEHLASAPAR